MNSEANAGRIRNADLPADYDIAIVGSGPAGLSAASRAVHHGNSHILFEAEAHASDTIYQYQKRKFVMAEPALIPLRSGMSFGEGRREAVLDTWNAELSAQKVNIAYQRRVTAITCSETNGLFTLACEDGFACTARSVILAIGLQGNVRKLGVPGQDLPGVQYTLSDPDEYNGETIVVVGTGDAGIENALALSEHNKVLLFNRGEEFNSCKDANRSLILAAEKSGKLTICYSSVASRVEEAGAEPPLRLVYDTPKGERTLECHRIIGRMGATPPRKLVEGFGVKFSSNASTALPILSETYESSVPGLFIAGALGGYPLIKQAMNQGYEVVDTINGLSVEPADEPLLRERLRPWQREPDVPNTIAYLEKNVPLMAVMSRLQIREVLLESEVKALRAGEIVFERDDYTNTFFVVAAGAVNIMLPAGPGGEAKRVPLGRGEFFGEMGLIAGRRRSATVVAGEGCVLIEIPRRTMLKLMGSSEDVARRIDEAFVRNALMTYMKTSPAGAASLVENGVEIRRYKARQVIFSEGDEGDGLYLVRRGSVTISRQVDGRDVFVAYIPAGDFFGEMALLQAVRRNGTARATVMSEILVLGRQGVIELMAAGTVFSNAMQLTVRERTRENIRASVSGLVPHDRVEALISEGLGEATNVLVIDESLCVQCDNCETACAETHQGISRLDRKAGASHGLLHIPVACRHCEHPHCMKECPPNALSRGADGEVFIADTCIGCGNCERNCPYGVITMAPEKRPRFGGGLLWLLLGLGRAPGDRAPAYDPDAKKKAVKCDLCASVGGGPACVRACPTGAAFRTSPESLFESLAGSGSSLR